MRFWCPAGLRHSSREDEAKSAWLAKLDAPTWGAAAAAVSAVASEVRTTAAVSEDEAKLAWLARLDTPAWGRQTSAATPAASAPASSAPPVSVPAGESAAPAGNLSEEEAKLAWLARLDAPTWGQAAAAVTQVAADASLFAAMEQACETGVQEACDSLSREEEAKREWLAKLDAPAWGAAAAAVTAVAAQVAAVPAATAGEIAKHSWLTHVDMEARRATRGVMWGDHLAY